MLEKTNFPFGEDTGIHTIYGDFSKPQHPNYISDIVYANHGGIDLHIHMLTEAQPGDKRPCLVYVQGSGWQKQAIQLYIPKMMPFAFENYVVACVEYRTCHDDPFPAQIQDVRAAIRFLRKNAEQYGIDADHIALMGDSSGGHTVLMAAIADGYIEDTPDHGEYSSKVNCVIDFYAPTHSFETYMDAFFADPASDELMKLLFRADSKEAMKELIIKSNPINYISADSKIPPILIMHGDRDEIVSFNDSVALYEKLRETGHEVEFYKILGAGHGVGFWIEPVYETVKAFMRAYV